MGNEITISSDISKCEQLQWLYEEIGHVLTSVGDITKYHVEGNMVQEKRARHWGMEHQVPKDRLERLTKTDVDSDYEIADDLGVQTDYLHMVGFMYGYHFKDIY